MTLCCIYLYIYIININVRSNTISDFTIHSQSHICWIGLYVQLNKIMQILVCVNLNNNQQQSISKDHILEMSLGKLCLLAVLVFSCLSIVDRTYYIYLGLDISASHQEIVSAYKQKKNKIQSTEESQAKNNKLKLLQQAYSILGTPEKRSLYDRLNKDLLKKDKVVNDAKRITDKNNRKAKPMLITLPVSVQDVYHGKTIQASFLKQVACQKCRGTGADSPKFLSTCSRCGGNGFNVVQGVNYYGQRFINQNTCPVCQGGGKQVTKVCPSCNGKKLVTKQQKIKIKIPRGLPDGNVIKLTNVGDEPIIGAPADFEVTIVEIPTEHWSREGQNLIHTVQISFKEAIFGFSKKIIHLSDEEIPISRSQVTTRQTTMTIPNKGIENHKTGKQGKLTIKFKIVMPKFNDEQLDMWEQFFKNHKL